MSVWRPVNGRRRAKVTVTVDRRLLGAVDAFVAEHPGLDRSKVFDEALHLWCAGHQDKAMEKQFLLPPSPAEMEEQAAWHQIQGAAAKRIFSLDSLDATADATPG